MCEYDNNIRSRMCKYSWLLSKGFVRSVNQIGQLFASINYYYEKVARR